MSMTSKLTCLPVGSMPMNSPSFVPWNVLRVPDLVSFGRLVLDDRVEIEERAPQRGEELLHALAVRRERPERAVVRDVVGQDLLGDALVSLRLVLLDETADDRLVVHGCASSRGPERVGNRGWAGSATSRDATCAGRRVACRRSGTSGSTSPRTTRRRRAAACRRSAGTACRTGPVRRTCRPAWAP